jgi:hypothetical protein
MWKGAVALCLAAVIVAVGFVVASGLLPVVTVPNGRVGLQPRETLVVHYGWRGLLPALGLLVVTVVFVGLLWSGVRAAVVLARVVASLLLAVTIGSVVAFHLVGLMTVPVGALLVVAAFTVETAGRPRSLSAVSGAV